MRRGTASSALALLFALSTAAPAAPRAERGATGFARAPSELLGRFDVDGDGRVIEQEYLDYLALGFRARDRDGNDVLEGPELPPGATPLARAENEARLRRQFARQDGNRDGHLDAAELLAPPR